MTLSRLFLSLFLMLSLLFAQQAGAAHALGHVLKQSQDHHSAPSTTCDECENYAQLGAALNVGTYVTPLRALPQAAILQTIFVAPSHQPLAAPARGPPPVLQALA